MYLKFLHFLKSLKSTFLCKIYEISGKLDYPKEVLPKPNYKINLDFDSITQVQNVFLLRRAELNFEDTFFKLGNRYVLKADAIPIDYNRIPNLSTNLLGGGFKSDYSAFRVKMDSLAGKKWIGTNIYLCEHIDSYSKVEGGCIVYLNANNLHNAKFPYNLGFNQDFHKEVKKFEDTFSKNIIRNEKDGKIDLIGSTKIVHDPINLNYWHVELKVLDFANQELKNASSNKHKQIAQHALDNLVSINSFGSVNEIGKIPHNLYKAI